MIISITVGGQRTEDRGRRRERVHTLVNIFSF